MSLNCYKTETVLTEKGHVAEVRSELLHIRTNTFWGLSMRFKSLITLGAALTMSVVAAAAQASDALKIAVTDVEGLEKLQVEWGPFKKELEAASGLKFDFFPVANRTAAAEALKFKKVDLVLTGPAEYVVMNKRTDAYPIVGFSRPDYFCAIVVMADSGITQMKQLMGKKVVFKSVGSTSGHLCPAQVLMDYGISPTKDVDVKFVARNIMHESLKNGSVDALGDNYRSWVNKARNKDKLPAGAFRVLARSGDLPNDVLLAGKHVDPADVKKVRKAFDTANDKLIAAILTNEENMKYHGMKFLTEIKDRDYDVVRAMYSTIGYPQYSDFVGN